MKKMLAIATAMTSVCACTTAPVEARDTCRSSHSSHRSSHHHSSSSRSCAPRVTYRTPCTPRYYSYQSYAPPQRYYSQTYYYPQTYYAAPYCPPAPRCYAPPTYCAPRYSFGIGSNGVYFSCRN